MKTAIERKQISFRLSTDLLKRLQKAAKRENRSLNNFGENTLMDAVYNIPATNRALAAIGTQLNINFSHYATLF